MAQPWLSVLIPTYNGEKYLPSALDSIIMQGENDIECIVVDDGSTDATLSILNAYKNKISIKIIQREKQGNWVSSTNYALSLSNAEYICFLHQDDVWFKNRLNIMKPLIDQFPEVGFFLHSSHFIDQRGNYLGSWKCPLPHSPEIITSSVMIEKLLVQNFISIPAPIFKRELALNVGGLDEALWYTADWDLWLKISNCSNALYYSKPLTGFRVHPNSQTIKRSSYPQDFRQQLASVVNKHFILWEAPDSLKKEINKIAAFSMDMNVALAGIIHQKNFGLFGLLIKFLLLGPVGWVRYLENSRIWERVAARLKARINNSL